MTTARFSPFELMLLKSRHQADTAALLLLAWVLVGRGPVGEPERARLVELTGDFRHGHAPDPILAIAASQDLDAIQLAAEVLQREVHGERAHPFLRRAIALAAGDGRPSIANQHILRFFADLLGVPPGEFAPLFEATTGKALGSPADPSRTAYWRAKEHHRREREHHERARERQRQEAREREERERARREREREERAWREEAERERFRQQRRRDHSHRQSPPGDRTRRALAVLGLEPGASRVEIRRAYRRLAQAHHPDRFFQEGEAVVAIASQRFQRIRRAYDYLMEAS